MAAVTDVVNLVTGNLPFEVIQCVASDAETYVSRFKTIYGALANSKSRTGAWCSWSGGTVTFNCSSASDDTVIMLIIGK
jgi:hypothetical protein